jgi:hypothetical protein
VQVKKREGERKMKEKNLMVYINGEDDDRITLNNALEYQYQ